LSNLRSDISEKTFQKHGKRLALPSWLLTTTTLATPSRTSPRTIATTATSATTTTTTHVPTRPTGGAKPELAQREGATLQQTQKSSFTALSKSAAPSFKKCRALNGWNFGVHLSIARSESIPHVVNHRSFTTTPSTIHTTDFTSATTTTSTTDASRSLSEGSRNIFSFIEQFIPDQEKANIFKFLVKAELDKKEWEKKDLENAKELEKKELEKEKMKELEKKELEKKDLQMEKMKELEKKELEKKELEKENSVLKTKLDSDVATLKAKDEAVEAIRSQTRLLNTSYLIQLGRLQTRGLIEVYEENHIAGLYEKDRSTFINLSRLEKWRQILEKSTKQFPRLSAPNIGKKIVERAGVRGVKRKDLSSYALANVVVGLYQKGSVDVHHLHPSRLVIDSNVYNAVELSIIEALCSILNVEVKIITSPADQENWDSVQS